MDHSNHDMSHDKPHEMKHEKPNYTPFIVIILMLLIPVVVVSMSNGSTIAEGMMNFMGVYFLAFSGFKFLDLKGFVDGYQGYDLLAKKVPSYGYVYPFLEFFLGLAYITRFELQTTNWVTLVLMLFGALGVLLSLKKSRGIMCACLGAVIKLPLTKITLFEDFLMAAMAALMLFVF